MAVIFDGHSKTMTLTAGTVSLSVRQLWTDWVNWFLTGDNSKYLPAFEFVGGNDIDLSAGTYIPIYAFLMNGWKIKPQESNHTLSIGDGILLVNGGGDPFNDTDGAYVVRINYQQPVQAIAFSTEGGSGVTPADVWSYGQRTLTERIGIERNVALSNFTFLMTDSVDHTPSTGLLVSAYRSIDGADFAACAGVVSEVGNGIYKINLAATDLNGKVITLRFTATNADDRLITIITEP